MQQAFSSEDETITVRRTTLVCLLLTGIWLFAHPWMGIWHDARLYALQALSHLQPENYRNDLFFFSGSQDDYSFFSPVYAALISLLNLHAATISLLFASYVLWVAAAAWLLRNLLQGFAFWLGLILIFAMPRGYGGYGDLLRFAEPFLTPRLIAEGLAMLSLSMMLSEKRLTSLAAMAAAIAMHPLMALAGAGFVGLYVAQERPKIVLPVAALGLALLFGLAYFNVAPFDRLMTTMDSQWFDLVFARSPFVFWDGWKQEYWVNQVLLCFSLLATAGIAAQGIQRRAFLAALVLGGTSLLLTWFGTALFHNLLLIQIQPWRSLWLVQVFSYIAAAWLVAQYWHRDKIYRFLLMGFLAAGLTSGQVGGILALLVAGIFIRQVRVGKEFQLSTSLAVLLCMVPVLVPALWLASAWMSAWAEWSNTTNQSNQIVNFMLVYIREMLAGAGSGVIAVALLLAVWRYGPDARKFVHLSAVAGVFFVLFLSIAMWQWPNQLGAYDEQMALHDPIPTFSRRIPVDAVAYWENDATKSWFALGRSNYASRLQTAGIVFSRQTAIEGKRRMDRLAALGMEDSVFDSPGNASRLPMPSFKGLVHVCHDPVLDFVILTQDFGAGVIERHFEEAAGKYFYLYDCAYLRRNFTDT